MKPNFKVVFDTNIFISAIIFGGNPRQCLELAREKKIQLFTSRAILLELTEKLREKFLWEEKHIQDVVEGLLDFTILVLPEEELNVVKDDADDNKILECALKSRAQLIISGDKHLLSLKKFKNISIIFPQEFLKEFIH